MCVIISNKTHKLYQLLHLLRPWWNLESFHQIWYQSRLLSHNLFSALIWPFLLLPWPFHVHSQQSAYTTSQTAQEQGCPLVPLQEPLSVQEMHPLPLLYPSPHREPLPTSFCGGRARSLEFSIPISHHSFYHICSGWSYKIKDPLKRNGVGIKFGLFSGGIYSASCLISSSTLS